VPTDKAPIKLLTWDLDDTLYPERDYVFSGYAAVAAAHADLLGEPGPTLTKLKKIFNSPDRARSFNTLLAELGVEATPELVDSLVETYRAHQPKISLYPDAAASLADWRPLVHTAIVSDGYLVPQENKIAALSLTDRVDEVVLTDRWGRQFWKPHPRAFQHLQNRFSVTGAFCAYVSDNPAKDFVAPNELNWITIRIRRPGGIHEHAVPAPGGKPRFNVSDLSELSRLLQPA
jgi:putative hydrolase of the HAD superfamily